MAPIWQSEIIINLFLQNLGGWLTPFMQFFSFLGLTEFYIIFIPLCYWCFDAVLALRIALLLTFSGYTNGLLKVTFHGSRPYWFDPKVKAIASEGSFGLPSGHAQNAASIWGYLAVKSRHPWFTGLMGTLIFFIAFSRLYLGVHFTSDVLAGLLLGVLILFLVVRFEVPLTGWFTRFSFRRKIILLSVISLALFGFGLIWIQYQSHYAIPSSWIMNAQSNPDSVPINPYSPNDLVTLAGVFGGVTIGYVWINHNMVYRPSAGTVSQKMGRYFTGMLGVVLIAYGLAVFLPGGVDFWGSLSRFFRFALACFWMSAIAPLLFKKLKLL